MTNPVLRAVAPAALEPAAPEPPAFPFRALLVALRRNLWPIAPIVGAALLAALAITLLQVPRYTAAATIQINDSGGRVLASAEDEPAEAPRSAQDTDRFLRTQADVLQSRSLALRVAQALRLTGEPRFYAAQGETPLPPAAGPQASANAAVRILQRDLAVTLPRDSRIVTIRFTSTDPALAARIANSYASEFIAASLQRRFDSSAYARTFLSDQLRAARGRVERSEQALNAYARTHGLIRAGAADAGDQPRAATGAQTVTGASLFQLNQAANAATARRIEAEGRWRAAAAAPLLGAGEALRNPAVNALLTRKAELEGLLADDRARHLDDYPTVRAKQSELDAVGGQLQTAAGNVRTAIEADYRAARAAEQQLIRQVAQLKGATLTEQDRMVRYGLLSREAETNRQVYDGLLERYKQLNAVAGASLSNVALIDTAPVPDRPSSPRLLRNLALGLLAGLTLAGIAVLLREQFDDAIRVPEDIETKLALPLLGVVPLAPAKGPEAALADPKSALAEAYNSLRGALLHATPQGLPHVLLVTSAQPGEGKTTTSIALASALARMGKRCLLIDADLRRPALHHRLGLPNARGLSTLLTSGDPLASAAVPAGQPNLAAIPAGPLPPSPTELLATARLEALLEQAALAHEVVIVDSPPILGLADAPAMAALADGVVLVIEAERSRHGALRSALRRLRAVRPILLGAVLTKFDPAKAGNSHSDYYGYDYYHYDSEAQARG